MLLNKLANYSSQVKSGLQSFFFFWQAFTGTQPPSLALSIVSGSLHSISVKLNRRSVKKLGVWPTLQWSNMIKDKSYFLSLIKYTHDDWSLILFRSKSIKVQVTNHIASLGLRKFKEFPYELGSLEKIPLNWWKWTIGCVSFY